MKVPFWKNARFWVTLAVAAVVIALLLTLLLFSLGTAAPVYEMEGATLREDVYRYWFACYKYVYQIRYKDLSIPDTPEGWGSVGSDGRTYGEAFDTVIDEEIRMRFAAASLFDSYGYTLSETTLAEIEAATAAMEENSYGEDVFALLKERYGATESTVKQVALYEKKYEALREYLFADRSVVYTEPYLEALDGFYRKYYSRYNLIFIKDSSPSSVAVFEAALAQGMTEAQFTAFEAQLSENESKVTSGSYPNGIYLYAGASYSEAFRAELLSAFRDADEVGKVVKVRAASETGTYYVMRYALDDAPYLSEDEQVSRLFAELPDYAVSYLYRDALTRELSRVTSLGVAEGYTVAATPSCKDYNILRQLGS